LAVTAMFFRRASEAGWRRISGRCRAVGVLATTVGLLGVWAVAVPCLAVAGVAKNKTFQFSQSNYSANETDSPPRAVITVTRSYTKGPASVHFATSDGTAIAGTDYTRVAGSVLFKGNQSTATVLVPLLDDATAGEDPTATVNLGLDTPSRGYTIGSPASATLTINEDLTASAPGNVRAFANDSYDVDVTWNSVAGAVGYTVYRSTDGITYSQIGTTSGATSFTDHSAESGTPYSYEVTATSDDGVDSDKSSAGSVTTPSNLLSNGNFEAGSFDGWTTGASNDCISPSGCSTTNTMPGPSIDNSTVLAGSYSAFLGQPTTCTTEGAGYNFIYQALAVPSTGTTVLTWYYNGQSSEQAALVGTSFDGQEELITDSTGSTVLDMQQKTLDQSQTWTQRVTADLTSEAGSDVRIYFRVYEDGFGDCTGMNVDNVSVTNSP
jgi:Calx-beta domain